MWKWCHKHIMHTECVVSYEQLQPRSMNRVSIALQNLRTGIRPGWVSCTSHKLLPEWEQGPSSPVSGLWTLLKAEGRYHGDDWASSLLSWQLLHSVLPSQCERAAHGSQGVTTGLVCMVSVFNKALPSRWCQMAGELPFNPDRHLTWNRMLPGKRRVQPHKLYWTFLTGEPQKYQNYWEKKKKLDRRWWYGKFSWEGGRIIFSWNAAVSFEMVTVIEYSSSGSSYPQTFKISNWKAHSEA